jgi:asparagine synthase (glutamine-hydrolysing)
MSIIFGVRQAVGHVVDARQLSELSETTARFASDGLFVQVAFNVGMAHQAFHTHSRSKLQTRPILDRNDNMLALDGRLDNYEELRSLLNLEGEVSDSEIMLAAFAKYGDECFRRFVGDWSLSLWCRENQTLYLARDHAGTRTLFYSHDGERISWSTTLETFFLHHGTRRLCRTYAHRYLRGAAIGSWTPYEGIRAVRPAHFLRVRGGEIDEIPHWNWIRTHRLRYRTDCEYDEEFISLFRRSVERRTAAWPGIVAQLSGGMDSTSIVCISDQSRRESQYPGSDLLETLSYFNDSEPNWNERPFFELVERTRGKMGTHIDLSQKEACFDLPDACFLLPGADGQSLKRERALEEALGPGRCRVLVSGIGGDELLGGVPNSDPELAEYLLRAKLSSFFAQSLQWSLATRQPIYRIWKSAFCTFLRPRSSRSTAAQIPVPWLIPHKDLRNELSQEAWRTGLKHGLASAAAVDVGKAWWSILESQPHLFPAAEARYEYRYPMLDRDLVEFLMAVPPEQLVRPGRRRFLMRRALRDIVPEQVLERRRKAYVLHGYLTEIAKKKHMIYERLSSSPIGALSFVDQGALLRSLNQFERGDPALWRPLMRSAVFALWLEASLTHGRLSL